MSVGSSRGWVRWIQLGETLECHEFHLLLRVIYFLVQIPVLPFWLWGRAFLFYCFCSISASVFGSCLFRGWELVFVSISVCYVLPSWAGTNISLFFRIRVWSFALLCWPFLHTVSEFVYFWIFEVFVPKGKMGFNFRKFSKIWGFYLIFRSSLFS